MVIQDLHYKLMSYAQQMSYQGIVISVIWQGNEITLLCPNYSIGLVESFIKTLNKNHQLVVKTPNTTIYRWLVLESFGERAPDLLDVNLVKPNSI